MSSRFLQMFVQSIDTSSNSTGKLQHSRYWSKAVTTSLLTTDIRVNGLKSLGWLDLVIVGTDTMCQNFKILGRKPELTESWNTCCKKLFGAVMEGASTDRVWTRSYVNIYSPQQIWGITKPSSRSNQCGNIVLVWKHCERSHASQSRHNKN